MLIGIKGEKGRFRFIQHVRNTKTGAEWIDVCGGSGFGTNNAVVMFRSFRPDRVTRVYPEVIRKKREKK